MGGGWTSGREGGRVGWKEGGREEGRGLNARRHKQRGVLSE